MRPISQLCLPLATFLVGACASVDAPTSVATPSSYSAIKNPSFDAIAAADDRLAKDRKAILAMRGDYRVDFHFEETVPLKWGYDIRDAKNTGGYETVIVVEQGPGSIVLQHLLVAPGGHVIKHWRQDWTYEASERFEFVADQTWQVRELDAEKTKGAWTQCVFEVSDAPRYCGTGRWNHRYGVSTWTSDRTWRPLPRREYTTRQDYNVINAENRHTVTPFGWTHEQDNTKTVRSGRETEDILVREFGFNDYRNVDGYDFAPARAYWAKTSEYWARVREAWSRRLTRSATLELTTEVDGMPIISGTFEHAEKVDEMSASEQTTAIEMLLDEWTKVRGGMAAR